MKFESFFPNVTILIDGCEVHPAGIAPAALFVQPVGKNILTVEGCILFLPPYQRGALVIDSYFQQMREHVDFVENMYRALKQPPEPASGH
jgi:hypothetical protein